MAFGIPGDAVTAVMLGALTIHGIQSGPLFILQNATLAYGMFAAYILAHALVLAILFPGVRWMLRIVTIPKAALFPIVLVLCVIGAYALNNNGNVYVLLVSLVRLRHVKFGFRSHLSLASSSSTRSDPGARDHDGLDPGFLPARSRAVLAPSVIPS